MTFQFATNVIEDENTTEVSVQFLFHQGNALITLTLSPKDAMAIAKSLGESASIAQNKIILPKGFLS